MELINLTPHPINVWRGGTQILYLESQGLARCEERQKLVAYINDIPLHYKQLDDVVGLPAPRPDTCYVVSLAVALAQPWRSDLLVPNMAVRDGDGHIIGCRSFATVANAFTGARRIEA